MDINIKKMKKRVYSLGFLTLKEEANLFSKLDKKGILYEYDHIKSEKPLTIDQTNLSENEAIALEESLMEEYGAQLLREVEVEENIDVTPDINKPEESIVEEDIDSLITEALSDDDYAIVLSDWKDIDGLIESAKNAFQQFGLVITEDPSIEGSDSVGFIVSKRSLTDEEVNEIAYAGVDLEDNEEDLDEIE